MAENITALGSQCNNSCWFWKMGKAKLDISRLHIQRWKLWDRVRPDPGLAGSLCMAF